MRFEDWPERLQAYLDSHRESHFQYGELDCCLFVCDCVLAMTGHDMAAWFRGRYNTRKSALSLIRERTGHCGVTAVARYAAKEAGYPSIPPLMARRGDMVLVGTGRKAILGLISLAGADVMCISTDTIQRIDLKHVTAAWRV